MKLTLNNQLTPFHFLFAAFLAFIILAGTSCQSDDPTAVTDEDAVDLMESTLSSDDGGMATTMTDGARLAMDMSGSCLAGDSTVSRSFSGSLRQYSFDGVWNWTVVCDQFIPQSFTLNSTSSGTYNGPRLNYNGQSASTLTVTNLVTGGDLTLNGTASQNASVTVTARQEVSFDSELGVTMTDITVDKLTFEITGGMAAITLTTTTDEGTNFDFAATVAFLGNGDATITINGNSYTISI